MKRAAPLILLMCLVACRAAAEQANYTLYVLGVPLADASLNVDLAAPVFRMSMRFHTTGLANVVDGGRLEDTVSGRFVGDRPAPQSYASSGFLHGQTRVLDMTWQAGTPVVTGITPPNATEREAVPPPLLAGSIDPMSLIVLLVHDAEETGRCDGSARSYDGRDLQFFDAKTGGEEALPLSARSSFSGRALRCQFTSQTLAGFRFGAGGDQDRRTHRGTIWLARVLPGLPPIPVRAAVETRWFGDATIYLTSVSP